MLSWLKSAFEKLWSFLTDLQATFLLWLSSFFGRVARWIWDRLLTFLTGLWSILVVLFHSFLSGVGFDSAVHYFDELFHLSPEVLGFADAMGLRTILLILGIMLSAIVLSWGFKVSIALVRLIRGGG